MIWNDHIKHRSEFPQEQLAKYHGKYVAWNLEGTQILAWGENDLEVFQAVAAAGNDPEQVVFSFVPFPDEVEMGGAFLHQEEATE
jgi:hypothetical protein